MKKQKFTRKNTKQKMLVLNAALGILILLAIRVAIKMKTGEQEATETHGIKNEKLIQNHDTQSNRLPGVNGSSVTSQTTGTNVVRTHGINLTIYLPENLENQTQPVNMKTNTTVAENDDESTSKKEITIDKNTPQKLEAANDTIENQLNRGTATGSLLYLQLVIYSLNIFRMKLMLSQLNYFY